MVNEITPGDLSRLTQLATPRNAADGITFVIGHWHNLQR